MSRLNVLEDINACGGSGDSKGQGLSGIDTSQVIVMIVCVCLINCFLYSCLSYIAMLYCLLIIQNQKDRGFFGGFFVDGCTIFIQQICIYIL